MPRPLSYLNHTYCSMLGVLGGKDPPTLKEGVKMWQFSRMGFRARREALGLSRKNLADVIGVGEATIRNWEIGKGEPRDPMSIHMLLGGLEDEMLLLIDQLMEPMDGDKPETGEPLYLRCYEHQSDYETMEPYWSKLLPIQTHRVAVAIAANMLNDDNIPTDVVGIED